MDQLAETTPATGQCLCGKVRFRAQEASVHTGACHCGMCVKWGGGPLLAVDCGTRVSFDGEQHITRFQSSEWAERGFCSECGTHLFYHLKGAEQYMLPAGLFDDQSKLQMDHQIFIDKKPAHYSFANQTQNMTEAEVFAKYAPPE
ncbi:MAG: GFA family protein [Granulosicoccaceae bacterium]